jgi:hypothetical protein
MAIDPVAFSSTATIEDFDPNFGRQSPPVVFNGVTYNVSAGSQLWSDINWSPNGYYTGIPGASGGFGLTDIVDPTTLQIDFNTPVNRVGILGAPPVATYTMTAYNDALTAIGSVTRTSSDGRAVFMGLQGTVNIRRIVITETGTNGQVGIFDDLRYEAAPLPAPVQTAPAHGSVFSHFPRTTTLTWAPVAGAASYIVEVDCFHCHQSGQWSAEIGQTFLEVPGITTTSYTFDFVGAQPGRWRVRAVDANGVQGQITGWFEFTYTN